MILTISILLLALVAIIFIIRYEPKPRLRTVDDFATEVVEQLLCSSKKETIQYVNRQLITDDAVHLLQYVNSNFGGVESFVNELIISHQLKWNVRKQCYTLNPLNAPI